MHEAGKARPFAVEFSESAIADLRQRLQGARWPEPETVQDWSQGVPLDYLQELCDYWANRYDFAAAQKRLNRYDHHLIEIDGLDIHYLHCRSVHQDAIPLILTHGWPGTFVEFLDVVGPLVDPPDPADAFHVVVPSLPGYGFGGRPTEPGWDLGRTARAWDALMRTLGYHRYGAQGGDWGSMVTASLARQFPGQVIGIHVNLPVLDFGSVDLTDLTTEEQAALESMAKHQAEGRGYAEQQSTRPQTLAYGLTDSPIGQCAWIIEKFWSWTDSQESPEDAIDRDRLLDNVSVYWFSATAASSARFYWESLRNIDTAPLDVPAGVSIFPKDILPASRRWVETRYRDLRWFNRLPGGGHFAAMERPAAFVSEVQQAFRTMR
jgi:pimeloyl-ACP methyl ester carboxylesterase